MVKSLYPMEGDELKMQGKEKYSKFRQTDCIIV